MIESVISQLAEDAGKRYKMFAQSLSGAFLSASIVGSTPKDLAALNGMTGTILNAFVEDEAHRLSQHRGKLFDMAISDAEADMKTTLDDGFVDDLAEMTNMAGLEVVKYITNQASRDASEVNSKFRRLSLEAAALSDANEYGHSTSLIGRIEGNASFIDRSGKKWNSSVYARTIIRHHLLNVYNEVYLLAAMRMGYKEVTTTGGITFAVERYESIRDEVFHPNSHNIIHLKKVSHQ